jgi:LuxR family maltose regulon positive regulatory protein
MDRLSVDGRLTAPPLPARHVPRPRLLDHLDTALARPVTLIAAGPGYGKSILLSEWSAQRAAPTAWLSLDRELNRPLPFWSVVREALRAAGYPVARSDEWRYDGGTNAVISPFLDAVRADPVVLVLDDAHVIDCPEVLDGLAECVQRWGERLRLVISARNDPLLPLARYRLHGDIAEIRAPELAMTPDECTTLLRSYDIHLGTDQFGVLYARTEGWATGIRLSAMRMEGGTHPESFVTELALDHGSIGEYLIEEVLNRQSPDVRRLLIETSFLHTVNGPLAEAITGLTDADQMLADLARSNAFVSPVDAGEPHAIKNYRYHQLMTDILRYLLKHEGVERRRPLVRRAARWYGRAGDLVAALRFGAESDDWSYVAGLLARGGFAEAMRRRLDLSTLDTEALDAVLPVDDDEACDVMATRAALLAWQGRPEQARIALDALQRQSIPLEFRVAITVAFAELLVARSTHDVAAAQLWTARLLQSDERGVAAAARYELAMTFFYSASHDEVDALLATARDDARAAGLDALELELLAQLAHVNAFWGRVAASASHDRRANLLLRRHPTLVMPAVLILASAERAFGRANIATALAAAGVAGELAMDERDRDLRDEITMVKTLLLITSGRLVEAKPMTTTAADTSELIRAYQTFAAMTIETALGRPNAAVRLRRSNSKLSEHAIIDIGFARALAARGDLDEAADLLRTLMARKTAPFLEVLYLEAATANAQVAQARGQGERLAVRRLLRGIAHNDGELLLPFVSNNEQFAELRTRHSELAAQWPVDTDAVIEPVTDVAEIDTRLMDPLTDRERAVLRWLATTMSVNEIADELCLSLNTVKTHIAAIYRKLATPRRRDAVNRARALELL